MLVDGRKLAGEIGEDLRGRLLSMGPVKLLVIQVGENPVTESFVKMKKSFAEKIGIQVQVENFPISVKEASLSSRIQEANSDMGFDGIIVQLPLPQHIDTKKVLDLIDTNKDPDVLSSESKALYRSGQIHISPPVVGAIETILLRHYVDVTALNVVVVGYGSLVGEPITVWLKKRGVDYALLTEETPEKEKIISKAELIISGAGVPGFIKPEMIQEGVVIIDAGTSESGGIIKGDADPACAARVALMTPVPGGVGPVAVAVLFRNLIELKMRRK